MRMNVKSVSTRFSALSVVYNTAKENIVKYCNGAIQTKIDWLSYGRRDVQSASHGRDYPPRFLHCDGNAPSMVNNLCIVGIEY